MFFIFFILTYITNKVFCLNLVDTEEDKNVNYNNKKTLVDGELEDNNTASDFKQIENKEKKNFETNDESTSTKQNSLSPKDDNEDYDSAENKLGAILDEEDNIIVEELKMFSDISVLRKENKNWYGLYEYSDVFTNDFCEKFFNKTFPNVKKEKKTNLESQQTFKNPPKSSFRKTLQQEKLYKST